MDSALSQELDAIELARSALACLSLTNNDTVHETHVGRMRELWSRYDHAPDSIKLALKHLTQLREAEHLGHGYWLPTPTRTVSLTCDTSLIVSIAPTSELQRHFPSAKRAGLGRLVSSTQTANLPSQSIDSWLGSYSFDGGDWAKLVVESSASELSASILTSDTEAFSIKKYSGGDSKGRVTPTWVTPSDRQVLAWNGISLFRSKLGEKNHRYFLGRLTRNQGILEGPQIEDNLSLQYGLASILGKPLTTFIRKQEGAFQLDLPLIPPLPLRRLLMALCIKPLMSPKSIWLCHQPNCEQIISSVMEKLGSEIVVYE